MSKFVVIKNYFVQIEQIVMVYAEEFFDERANRHTYIYLRVALKDGITYSISYPTIEERDLDYEQIKREIWAETHDC